MLSSYCLSSHISQYILKIYSTQINASMGTSDNTGQQTFCPMRKNVCFWCIFGHWIQKCFQNFSIIHTLRSRLKGWNLLHQGTRVFLPWAPWRIQGFLLPGRCRVLQWCFFSVMEVLGHEYNPDQWRFFIDSSKVSLKEVPLHNRNRFPSVPLAHAANMKESYENMKLLLGKIKYDEFKWKLCGDLKVVALLHGMQLGYTKYRCRKVYIYIGPQIR